MSDATPLTTRFASAHTLPISAPSIDAERAKEVSAKRDAIADRATAHFERHRSQWTDQQFGKLLARDGGRMALRPNGAVDDRKAHLFRAADHLVRHRHAKRIATIHRAADRMMGRVERDGR